MADGTFITEIAMGLGKSDIQGPTNFPTSYSFFACDEIGNCTKISDCPECVFTLSQNNEFCADKTTESDFKKFGEGTPTDPYRLCTAAQLAGIASTATELSKSYKLMRNIDLASYYTNGGAAFKIATSSNCYFGALDAFTGTFDGNSKTINGFKYLNPAVNEVGLFSCAVEATIKNLTMVDVDIQAGQFVGAVVSRMVGTLVENVSVSGVVQGTNYVGGLVGYSERQSKFLTVTNSAAVTGTGSNVGGIGGFLNDYVHSATNSGPIVGAELVGGISGNCGWGTINRSTNNANITGTGTNGKVGGVAGNCWGLISNSSSSAGSTVSSNGSFLGGLVGYSQSVVLNSFSRSNVVNTGAGAQYTGGLGGDSYYIYNSYATGNVTSQGQFTGGLAGSGSASNSYASGNVFSTSSSVGGVLGQMFRNSTRVFSTGNVTGNGILSSVGPIIGTIDGTSTLTNSYFLSAASCSHNNGVTAACNSLGSGGGSHPSISSFFGKTNAPLSGWDFSGGTGDGINDHWIENQTSLPRIWFESNDSSVIPFAGAGTTASPYLIGSVADFNSIQSNPRWIDKVFKLTSNLDFNAQTIVWPGSNEGWFAGTFDGASFTISNISRSESAHDIGIGLFGAISSTGQIKNLKLANVTMSSDKRTGAVAGSSLGTISNVSVLSGSVTSTGVYVGGVLGYSFGRVEDASSAASVSGQTSVGGVVGYSGATSVIRSSSTGNVTGSGSTVGGLVGSSWYSYLEDSYATGNVIGGGQWVGGLAGYQIGHALRRSYATGNVNGNGSYVGGLTGYAAAGTTVVHSFATGEVRNFSASTGSLMGDLLDTSTQSGNFVLAGTWCDSNSTTPGSADACNSIGLTKPQISDFYLAENLPLLNWDFSSVWKTNLNGMPTLRSK